MRSGVKVLRETSKEARRALVWPGFKVSMPGRINVNLIFRSEGSDRPHFIELN